MHMLHECVGNAHVLACAYVCGDQRLASVPEPVTFHPISLSQGRSLNMKPTVLARLAIPGLLLSLPQ